MGLRVEGEVVPNGTRSTVGGIVGSNAGTVKNCSFSGTVQGGSYIGGIAGVNELTGVIQSCVVQGTVSGNHFTGGIAGENVGVIRSCDNRAEVNAAANQNTIGLSDITLETITGTEASNTVTDIGGIAGANTGVLRRCRNFGPVGYRQMGYNIGGIAGSQTGYILDCKNHAPVAGRKEVGGIVGQMEPVIRITFTEDTVQQLQGQMDDLSAMTQQASANAQGGANRISGELDEIQKQLGTAMDALEKLNPEDGLPDEDSLLAAQNAVSGAIAAMSGNMDTILTTAQQTTGALSDNLQAVANQMNAIGQTLGGAEQGLGGSLEDVSDQDTDQDRTSKVDSCSNLGTVLADMNAGGIVGAISVENDLDPEDELVFTGNNSLKFDGQVRSVVRDCHNGASVTANKQNAGGIIGLQRVGLVRECTSSAPVASEKADYVGGIAGLSQGYIRLCSVKGQITGDRYVGSIAGT